MNQVRKEVSKGSLVAELVIKKKEKVAVVTKLYNCY